MIEYSHPKRKRGASRNFYRYRQQAISILSIRLWATAAPDVDFWLEMLTLLEGLK